MRITIFTGIFILPKLRLGQGPGTNGVYETVEAFTSHLNQDSGQDLLAPVVLVPRYQLTVSLVSCRSLYLMALNFSDKQKWVATLEAIITHSPDTFKRKDAVSTRSGNNPV